MSVKILTMVLLGGCVIAAAKPGDLDRKFDPELRAWVAPEHATVAPDGRPWIGGGYDQGDGYSTGDLVRLGENGGVESEPAPGYLSRMVGDLSIGGLTATSLARPFLLAGGDFLLKGESGGWLRMNAAGLASGKAFPDRTADEIITPQFERDGQLWVIRQFAGGERRVERRQSADGSLDAGFSQAGGAPPDAHTAVPGPDGSVWVLAGDGNRWLPFPGTPLPAQRLCQMDGAGNLLGAPKIFEIPRMIELVAGPAGAFRLVFGADLSRWNYWPTPTSQSLKIEWYSAGGVLERARDFNLRTYETFLWAEAADGSFVATDATTPIPGSPQFFVGAVANLRAFGPDGVENTEFITPGRVHSVRALADGKWWIDGLRRIHADGSEDPSWRIPGLSTPAQVTALHALPDGRMLAGGNFATAAGVVRNRLVVFRKNGMVDPSFVADDRIGEWRSIAVSGAAVYVVTAEPVAYGAGVRSNLVKLDPSGAILESYSPQLRGGRLAGGLQPILNSQSVSEVSGVRALDGGSILVETYSGGEVPQSSFHRLRADGSPDPAFKVLSDSPRAYDVITKMNGGFVRGAVIYRKNGSVERDLTRDQVWLRPLCEWLGGVVFLEFDNSPTGRLRLWAGNRWAAWFRPPAITNVRDGVLASPGDLGWLYVHATLAAGPAELHRLSFTGRLDRTFDSPRFGDRARQAAGDWWTAEETGRVDFDPALQESLASPQAILWHPETRRLWVGGGFNTVNGQPRDGLARIVGGVARSRENRGFSAIYETRLPAPTDSMREGDPPMGQAAKSIDTDERAAARDGSWLLARIARRDEEALAALYHMWGDRLYSMALHWTADEGAAREALQDCFLRMWKKAGDFDPQKSRGFTWAAMILRGLCLDHLRKRKRRAGVWQDWETSATLEVPTRGGVEDLLFRDTVASVKAALRMLDASEVESVRLAIFDPGSVQDHADRWGVPLGTAKTRIHRAMEKLRALLKKGGSHEIH